MLLSWAFWLCLSWIKILGEAGWHMCCLRREPPGKEMLSPASSQPGPRPGKRLFPSRALRCLQSWLTSWLQPSEGLKGIQFSHAWIPRNCGIINACFKPLSLGVICYTANNQEETVIIYRAGNMCAWHYSHRRPSMKIQLKTLVWLSSLSDMLPLPICKPYCF